MAIASDTVLLEVGLLGQTLFSARFFVQWLASEHAGRSVVPSSFWYLSVAGGLVLFVYACVRRDPVFIIGQGAGLFVYARNLHLLLRQANIKTEPNIAQAARVPAITAGANPAVPNNRFLAPRFWPTWTLIALSRAISPLPIAWQLAAGRNLGRLAYRLLPRHRRMVQRNLEICFPERSPRARERIVHEQFESLGMAVAEMSIAWRVDLEQLRSRVMVTGLEHVQTARVGGRGVILLSGHTTCMEITGILLALLNLPVHTHYRRNRKNPLADRIALAGRGRYAAGQIDRDDVRGLVRVLSAGGMVLYSPDSLVRNTRRSALVPFFGEPALTHTGLCDIARLSSARVVPYLPCRLDDRGHYELKFLPALENFPTGNPLADMASVNALLEDWIRRNPAQYLWLRPRFGKRPPHLPDLYADMPHSPVGLRAIAVASERSPAPRPAPAERDAIQ